MNKEQESKLEQAADRITSNVNNLATGMRYNGVEAVYTVGAALVRRSGPLDAMRALLDSLGDVSLAYDAQNSRARGFYEAQRRIEQAMEDIRHAIEPEDRA